MAVDRQEKQIVEVDIDDIHEGMILANEISDGNGVKFIGDGVKMSKLIVKKLKNNPPDQNILIYKKSINPQNISSIMKKNKHRIKVEMKNLYETAYPDSDYKELEASLDAAADMLKNKIFNADSAKLINIKSLNQITDIIQGSSQRNGQVIQYIMKIRKKDDSLYKHSINVSLLSCMLGKWLGYKGDALKILTRTAMLHDLGKVKVDESVLYKPGKLSFSEFQIIKKHPEIGYQMLKDINYMSDDVRLGVLLHHEKEDGSGYPLGIKGTQIHHYAKIIAIADIFDALTANRIYHNGVSPLRVLEIFEKESFGKLDVQCTIKFIRHVSDFYEGCSIALSNGLHGRIIKMNISDISKPLILCENKFIDLRTRSDISITDIFPD